MRRFWDEASIGRDGGGLVVLLDGKPMRIPGGSPLVLHGEAMAEAIAEEWRAAGNGKGGKLSMDDVPLTRLAGTAQDRVAPNCVAVAAGLAAYAESDVLCYWAEDPQALVLRQARDWQPWLDWLGGAHGIRLLPTEGIRHRVQDPAALQQIGTLFAGMPAYALAALGIAVPAMGSAVLGLALEAGVLGSDEAYRTSSLDELFQREQWGEDAEATARLAQVLADIRLAERFLRLSRS